MTTSNLRAFIDAIVRSGPAVEFEEVPGGTGNYVTVSVFVSNTTRYPPLPVHKQLALSVLLGEPVPTVVLLSALEDAGIYPAGVLAAAKEAEGGPLDMGQPAYPSDEERWPSRQRFDAAVGAWCDGRRAEVYGLCRGVLGGGDAAIGRLFGRFLDEWFGRRDSDWAMSQWPTDDYLLSRRDSFPPLPRVFRHLQLSASPATAAKLARLIAHLERR